MANEISKLQGQLVEAQADLQRSLAEVSCKVESVALPLRAERKTIKAYPMAAVGVAAATGFFLGSTASLPSRMAVLALGVFVGFSLGLEHRSDEDA